MGDVVNLNQYRKERARSRGKKRAVENRARHGLGKNERSAQRQDKERERRELDGKRIDRKPGDEPPQAG